MSAVCTEWSASPCYWNPETALEWVLCKAVCCTVLSITMWAECGSSSPPNSITFTRSRGISSSIVCCHYTVHGVLEIQRMDRISMSSVNRDGIQRSPVQFMVETAIPNTYIQTRCGSVMVSTTGIFRSDCKMTAARGWLYCCMANDWTATLKD